MELATLKELVINDSGNFEQLADDFAEETYKSQDLTDRSKALLQKKMNLNSKLGIDSSKFTDMDNDNSKVPDRSEMAKNQAKERKKRNSIGKKNKPRNRQYWESRRQERNWSRDWEKPLDRRARKKQKFNHFSHNDNMSRRMNTSKVIKLEGKKVRFNCNDSERFVLNKLVDLYENQFVEFKRLKGLHLQMILNYICGFLNSYGGSLYIGIADDGYVKGITLSRQDIDQFQVDLDRCLRLFHPRVFPDQIQLTFHEISLNSRKQVGFGLYIN
jgi:hypothetical protein